MHDVERSASSLAEDEGRQRPSTLKAALVALALIAIGAGVLLFTVPSGAPDRAFNPAPPLDHSLTDEEAIARFRELHGLLEQSVRERDQALVPMILAPGSPMAARTRDAIRELSQNNVRDLSRTTIAEATVISTSDTEIDIQHEGLFFPCFQTEGGQDVTDAPGVIRQKMVWTLRRHHGSWLLWDVALKADRLVRKGQSGCD